MEQQAHGAFEVKLTPQAAGNPYFDRLAIHKQYHGHLEATAEGEMMTALTSVEGSAGYVALERVSGTLGGRSGTFDLQHSGLMDRGEQQLIVIVVPDSGTGELVGLRGALTIRIGPDGHFYTLDYTLPGD